MYKTQANADVNALGQEVGAVPGEGRTLRARDRGIEGLREVGTVVRLTLRSICSPGLADIAGVENGVAEHELNLRGDLDVER